MSNYNWCHGPNCHIYQTQDRVRGSKGSKVLRTRKIKTYESNRGFYTYFCSNGCYNDFANKHAEQIIRIAPRTEALETPINDPKKIVHTSDYTHPDGTNHTWTSTEISKRGVDTIAE